MTSSNRLVFFGTEQFSVPALEALLEAGYDIAAIITKPDARKGRGNKLFVHPIKQLGLDHNIPVWQPEKLRDIEQQLASLGTTAAVLVSYGKIIPSSVIDIFEPIGIINIHPSRLPQYRGPSPIEAAILAGDSTTAISIMKLDQGMDTGPVFAQQEVVLHGTETKPELYNRLSHEGANLLVHILPDILSGKLKPVDQIKSSDVSITTLITKQDGLLDPSSEDAITLERKIRAYLGYPKTKLTLYDNDVVVTSAKSTDSLMDGQLVVPCAGQTYLQIETLIAPSGRTMSGSDFLRGYAK